MNVLFGQKWIYSNTDKSETAKGEKKSSKASKASESDSDKAESSDKKTKRKASKEDKAEDDSGPESKKTKHEEEENDPGIFVIILCMKHSSLVKWPKKICSIYINFKCYWHCRISCIAPNCSDHCLLLFWSLLIAYRPL